MLEPVRCPACSTRYGLRPERVRPGIRRARCFQCGSLFTIDSAVQRLLAGDLAGAPARETVGVSAVDLSSIQQIAGLDGPALLSIQQEDLLEEPAAAPEPFATEPEFAPLPEDLPPSLTLGDLDDDAVDASLDKTLVETPLTPHPESLRSAPLEAAVQPEGSEPKAPSYASARDAIDKLLSGNQTPAQTRSYTPAKNSSQMDIEATLAALDSTLSGTHPVAPQPPAPPAPELGSTVHLSQKDLLAAMATSSQAPAEATIRMPVLQPAPAPQAPPAIPRLDFPPPVGNDSNLLKVHLGEEILTNQTVEQVTALIERGRILEHHMVARQFSDHWMEANKVPPLRPVFERLRRLHGAAPEPPAQLPPPPPMEAVPAKKSLFGGLFNRN